MKTYATATAFRRGLEDRLADLAKAGGTDLQRMRRQVAFDRLLVRLFATGNPPWRLKGGYALELKLSLARATRDLDLGLSAAAGIDMLDRLQAAGGSEVGDWFSYLVGEATMDLDGAPYGGARYPVEARLDGRPFAKFHLDVGLGDIQREPVEWVESRDWLGFAGIAPGRFPSISREEHFAQKLHAYTMPRGDRPNSRVKDLVDLVLLIEAAPMDRERLKCDITDTFRRRDTHGLPDRLEPPPAFWEPVFLKLAEECGIGGGIGKRFSQVAGYCTELLGWAREDERGAGISGD